MMFQADAVNRSTHPRTLTLRATTRRWLVGALVCALGFFPLAAGAEDQKTSPADPIAEVLSKVTPTIDVRARYEHGSLQHTDSSDAETLRVRLGLMSPAIEALSGKFHVFAELEHTEALDRDSYRAASIHGPTYRTVIADPESTELNRAWFSYKGFDSSLKFGRQRIKLANDRFVGNVGWRQNEQTYDAVRVTHTGIENLNFDYSYIWNVQRIFGDERPAAAGQDDFDSRTHSALVKFTGLPNTTVTAYAYLMDLENRAGDNLSNDTYGASVAGKLPVTDDLTFNYRAEAARQRDAGDSMLAYNADYLHGVLSATFRGFTAGGGYEVLGGSENHNGGGPVSFRTPLATLHKFNGFADVFLTTPATGLVDAYGFVTVPLPFGITFKGWYHDFTQDDSRGDIGNEVDLVLVKKLPWNLKGLAKYAHYQSDRPRTESGGPANNIRRIVLQIEYKYQ